MFNIMFNDSEKLVVNSKNKMKKLRFFLNILNMQLKVKIYFLNSEYNIKTNNSIYYVDNHCFSKVRRKLHGLREKIKKNILPKS